MIFLPISSLTFALSLKAGKAYKRQRVNEIGWLSTLIEKILDYQPSTHQEFSKKNPKRLDPRALCI